MGTKFFFFFKKNQNRMSSQTCWSCNQVFTSQLELELHDQAAAIRDELRLIALKASNILPNGFADLKSTSQRLLNPITRSCGAVPFVKEINGEVLSIARDVVALIGAEKLGDSTKRLLEKHSLNTISHSSSSSSSAPSTSTSLPKK